MIRQTTTDSFKKELYSAIHNLTSDVIKLALYNSVANLGPATTVYATANEISGTGYTAGGKILLAPIVSLDSVTHVAYVSFASPIWNPASFTARGALIYNSSKANRSIVVLDFGGDRTGLLTFTVAMPPNTAETALLRIV